MNSKSGRIIVASCVLLGLAGCVAYALIPGGAGGGAGAGAGAQALSDVGKFKVGSAVGEERAGFSGRSKVQIFTSSGDPNLPAISACLQSAEVEAEMEFFVGVLVDGAQEPQVEAMHREHNGLQVIVRGLNGAFLGGLPSGSTCQDLVKLLQGIRASSTREIIKSPIYNSLLLSAEAVDSLNQSGQAERAARFVNLLKEFEGAESPAVTAAESRVIR